MGGGERLFPACLRRLSEVSAVGGQSLHPKRGEFREAGQNAGGGKHLPRTFAQRKTEQLRRSRRSQTTSAGVRAGMTGMNCRSPISDCRIVRRLCQTPSALSVGRCLLLLLLLAVVTPSSSFSQIITLQ